MIQLPVIGHVEIAGDEEGEWFGGEDFGGGLVELNAVGVPFVQGGLSSRQFFVAEHGESGAGAEEAGELGAWRGEMDAVEGEGLSLEADHVAGHDRLAVPVRMIEFVALLDEIAAETDELAMCRNVEIGKAPLKLRAAAAGILKENDVGFLRVEESGELLAIALADIVRDEGQFGGRAFTGRRAMEPRMHVEQDEEKGCREWEA